MWNESTIVAGALFIFIALVFKPAKNAIIGILDKRTAEAIKSIEEANSMRAEAEKMLKQISKQLKEAEKDSKDILASAKEEAKMLIEEAKKEAERITNKKTEISVARINQQEKQIIEDLKDEAIQLAVTNVQELLLNELDKNAQMALIENGIKDTKKLVH